MVIYNSFMARVISIDGPAGAGCSTLSKTIEQEFGIPKVPTSLCYRGLSVAMLREDLHPERLSEDAISEYAVKSIGRFALSSVGVQLDGQEITEECRQEPHHQGSSIISKVSRVRREFTEPLVQQLVETFETDLAVSEGRDEYYLWKERANNLAFGVYLTAAAEIRAQRWTINPENTQLPGLRQPNHHEVLIDILTRDFRDISRDISPLLPAADALIVTPDTDTETLASRIYNQGQLLIDSGIRSKEEVFSIVASGIEAWRLARIQ